MPSPNELFTEIVSTTMRNHRKEIVDTVSNHNAFYRKMKKGGRTREETGGYSIVTPLEYAQNGTYQRYDGFDTLNVSQSDVISAAETPWRQIAIHVVASGKEMRMNAGPERIAKLAKAKMQNAMHTFANNFSMDLYSDGSLPNQISGLQAWVPDSGQGTIGGIDSSLWAFWQSKVQSAAAPLQGGAAITPGPTTMRSMMLPLHIALTRNADKPNMIIASDDWFTFYEDGLVQNMRYVKQESADGGFMELEYKGIPVFFDGSSGMPAAHMYFLNTNYMELVVHADANLTVMDEAKPYNQDGVVIPAIWMGNLVCSHRGLQGVAKA